MKKFRVLLVDDSEEFLNSAASFLSLQPGLEVVGQVRSGAEAIRIGAEVAPDLILMDIAMPQMNGLEATRRIKAGPAAPLVVILTLYDHPDYRSQSKMAGADGFVSKSNFVLELLPVIDALHTKPAA